MDSVGKKHEKQPPLFPHDCLRLIFEKLDSKTDRDCFGLTCHGFLDIQNSSRKNLKVTLPVSCSSSMLDKLLSRFTRLQSLSLSTIYPIFSDLVLTKSMLLHGSHLNSLDLSSFTNVNDTVVASIASSYPNLSVICLWNSNVTDSGIEIMTNLLRSLKRVDISMCLRITDRGISHLNRNCRQLTSLRITECLRIVGTSFREFPPTLVSLDAGLCAFDHTSVSGALNEAGSLEYLDVSYPIKGYELGSVAFGFAPTLKILNFQMCILVEDEDKIKISKGCPLLQEWNLSGCDKITLTGWNSIASHCQNLETLHVNRCVSLCNTSLLTLGNGCSRLSLIYLTTTGYIGITKIGVQSFKTQRPDVEIKDEEFFG